MNKMEQNPWPVLGRFDRGPGVETPGYSRDVPSKQIQPRRGGDPVAYLVAIIALLIAAAFLPGCASPISCNCTTAPVEPPPGFVKPQSSTTYPNGPPAAADEELWVIARGTNAAASPGESLPESGALRARIGRHEVLLPPRRTDVKASVTGCIGSVAVSQSFTNPFSRRIDATYSLSLPPDAAVNEFIMTIGNRRIRGIIRERADAEQIYRDALAQGYVASFATEARPNLFQESIGNIEPGHEIDVDVKYLQTLDYADGWYEFAFPFDGGKREKPRRDVSVHVDVDAGVAIEDFRSPGREVTALHPSPERLVVDSTPDSDSNADFVLQYRVAGTGVKTSLLTQLDERGGWFLLTLFPPAEMSGLARRPTEFVFVIDNSDSASPASMGEAVAAVRDGISRLRAEDTFRVIDCTEAQPEPTDVPMAPTPANVGRALRQVRLLRAGGSGNLAGGLAAALGIPEDRERQRVICIFTDALNIDAPSMLREVAAQRGKARLFVFGVGPRVELTRLRALAAGGRGAVARIGEEDPAEIMDAFFERISHPAMTSIQIDWGEWRARDVFPGQIPDLLVGRPIVLTGRFDGAPDSTVWITGETDGKTVRFEVPARSLAPSWLPGPLPALWAQHKLAALERDAAVTPRQDLIDEISRTARDYGLMSPYTAFITVDATRTTIQHPDRPDPTDNPTQQYEKPAE